MSARLVLLLSAAALSSFAAPEPALIPRPQLVEASGGTVAVPASFRIAPGPFTNEAAYLAGEWPGATVGAGGEAWIEFTALASPRPEAYELRIASNRIAIAGGDAAGAFYGAQTLLQLRQPGGSALPALRVADQPRFAWRGFMLDASRHFQTVDCVKRQLDGLAALKLNVFHWHLVDDHGWRLEVPALPRLTAVGAWREQPPVGRYGGYYTQAEIRDVVAYAAARHIAVVPEIEMPGHARAAIAAYPELCCSGAPTEVDHFFDFPCPAQRFPSVPGANVLCVSRDTTFAFLTNVLTDVLALFPSTYIHVGGDEVGLQFWNGCTSCQAKVKELGLKNGHELQAWFMQRVEAWLGERGRKLIGWDEILEGGLGPAAAVMSWRGTAGGVVAAKSGHDAVMSPGKPLYFDHGQTDHPAQPNHWPGRETLEEVYRYEPVPAGLTAEQAKHILGAQANLWTCFTHTDELLEIQTYPRLFALAETTWTDPAQRDWADFQARLPAQLARLDARGVRYWREPAGGIAGRWAPAQLSTNPVTLEWPVTDWVKAPGRYAATFDYQSGAMKLDIKSAVLLEDGREIARDTHPGFTGWRDEGHVYQFLVPAVRAGVPYALRAEVFVEGGTDSSGQVLFGEAVQVFAPERTLPAISTTTPATQDRDRAIYSWAARHAEVAALTASNEFDLLLIGDSITHYWGGEPKAPIARGAAAWSNAFAGLRVANLGFGWDRTENVLWRLAHGELGSRPARAIALLIGTNNLGLNSEEEIFAGIDAIVRAIHAQGPATRVLVLGILPRADEQRQKASLGRVNHLLQTRLQDRRYVDVYDPGNAFRGPDGQVNRALFTGDGLHPSAEGYAVLGGILRKLLRERGLAP